MRVRVVKPLDGLRALIEFEDGTKKEIDLEKYFHGPIFDSIRNHPEMFRTMKVDGGTICWENGADIDPDVLYYNLKPAWMEEMEFSR